MILKEDCSDFGYLKNDITGIGEGDGRFLNIPKCRLHKMSLCGCSDSCTYYSSNVLVVSE